MTFYGFPNERSFSLSGVYRVFFIRFSFTEFFFCRTWDEVFRRVEFELASSWFSETTESHRIGHRDDDHVGHWLTFCGGFRR